MEFTDGISIEKTPVNEVIDLHFDISDGLGAKIAVRGYEIFGGSFKNDTDVKKIFFENEKNSKNKEKTESEKEKIVLYDDEQIATENYYESKVKDEIDFDTENDDFEKRNKNESEKDGHDLRVKQDDENAFVREEQNNGSIDRGNARQNGDPLYERDRQKEDGGLEKLLSLCPKERALEDLIGGRFARATDENGKTFVVGKITAEEKTYRLAGVDGIFGSPPDESGDWFFFPKSPFSLRGEGYYMIVSDERGKRITGRSARFFRD